MDGINSDINKPSSPAKSPPLSDGEIADPEHDATKSTTKSTSTTTKFPGVQFKFKIEVPGQKLPDGRGPGTVPIGTGNLLSTGKSEDGVSETS